MHPLSDENMSNKGPGLDKTRVADKALREALVCNFVCLLSRRRSVGSRASVLSLQGVAS